MNVIRTQNLCKSYGLRRGIQDVGLTVDEGEIFGFLGPNGAGKSTTIRVLLGFLRPDSGTATILDRDCWKNSDEIKLNAGYVPGDVRLYPWLTAARAFRIISRIRRMDIQTQGLRLADQFDLDVRLSVRKMSRGNRQKLALVLALSHQPKVIILDEPTSGLDPLMQDVLAGILRDFSEAGHCIFFSSHTLSEVESLCQRVAIIRDGCIAADERIETLRQKASRTVVLYFRVPDDAAKCQLPEGAELIARRGNEVHLQITGSAAEFTRWAATQPITDLTIGPPDLETLFRRYYQTSDNQKHLSAS